MLSSAPEVAVTKQFPLVIANVNLQLTKRVSVKQKLIRLVVQSKHGQRLLVGLISTAAAAA